MAGPLSTKESSPARRVGALLALALFAAGQGGCGFVPRSKLSECHRLTQTLRADNTRLKNVALELRTQNQDLTQRAVDDARKIAAQDEAVQRLEKSVQAYQSERDTMAAAFESMKRQIRLSASARPSASLPERLDAFVSSHPGWSFDRATGQLAVAADHLFEPGSPAMRPQGLADLAALATALKDALTEGDALEVAARGGLSTDELRRTGFDEGAPASDATSARFLVVARASKVREALIGRTELTPGRIRLAAPAGREPGDTSDADPGAPKLVLRVVPRAGGLDAGEPTDK